MSSEDEVIEAVLRYIYFRINRITQEHAFLQQLALDTPSYIRHNPPIGERILVQEVELGTLRNILQIILDQSGASRT